MRLGGFFFLTPPPPPPPPLNPSPHFLSAPVSPPTLGDFTHPLLSPFFNFFSGIVNNKAGSSLFLIPSSEEGEDERGAEERNSGKSQSGYGASAPGIGRRRRKKEEEDCVFCPLPLILWHPILEK